MGGRRIFFPLCCFNCLFRTSKLDIFFFEMFSLVELQQQKKEAYFRLQIMIFFWGNGNTAKCKATIYKALIK